MVVSAGSYQNFPSDSPVELDIEPHGSGHTAGFVLRPPARGLLLRGPMVFPGGTKQTFKA